MPENVKVPERSERRSAIFDADKYEGFGVVSGAELLGDGGGLIGYIQIIQLRMTMTITRRKKTHRSLAPRGYSSIVSVMWKKEMNGLIMVM